jgi:hypothetical protein
MRLKISNIGGVDRPPLKIFLENALVKLVELPLRGCLFAIDTVVAHETLQLRSVQFEGEFHFVLCDM